MNKASIFFYVRRRLLSLLLSLCVEIVAFYNTALVCKGKDICSSANGCFRQRLQKVSVSALPTYVLLSLRSVRQGTIRLMYLETIISEAQWRESTKTRTIAYTNSTYAIIDGFLRFVYDSRGILCNYTYKVHCLNEVHESTLFWVYLCKDQIEISASIS